MGVDAITDQMLPFAIGALNGVPQRTGDIGAAQGALLSCLATVLIPASVASIRIGKYRQLRESYVGIREEFKRLTAELAARHRLGQIQEGEEFIQRVHSLAGCFKQEYQQYRKTRYARQFKSWAPLCIGGVLTVPAALVAPPAAAILAGGAFTMQLIDKTLSVGNANPNERVFHILAGVRRSIIKLSGVQELI